MPIQVRSPAEWQAAGIEGLLSVVIPAHNEEECIANTVRQFEMALSKARITYEILVINDNSSDETERILATLIAGNSRVRYVNNPPPHGFGFAVRRGLAEFRGDAVATVMADGSDDPADLVRFYHMLESGYDCVFGSRFMPGGQLVGYPKIKLLLNRIGNSFIRILFSLPYDDVTNAFKLYRRSAISRAQPLVSRHFNLTVELPLKCIIRGCRYTVLANSWKTRKVGISKLRIREMGSRYLFTILCCSFEKIRLRGNYMQQADCRDQLQVRPR